MHLDSSGTGAGGLKLGDHVSAVFVHEIVKEVEIENFPSHDIAEAGNQGDRNADGKRFGEGDVAVTGIVAVGAYAEEYQQERKNEGPMASALWSKAILSANGTVATIINEEMAPEIRPKVSMVFFMRVSC